MLYFHGTADGFYPFEGGLGRYSIGRSSHAGVGQVIDEWAGFDHDRATPRLVRHVGWEEQIHDGPAPVVLVLVDRMGHQIAGGRDDGLPGQATRAAPDSIEMTLQFFADHPMP